MADKKLRTIAIYLPQFHPTSENDAWWGKGFTEWTNVTKAKPLFKGHYQPHLPADLGFYDLRVPEVREQQVQLAQQYGVSGFCYYHYWFNGKRIINRPFDEVLSSKKLIFPFMLFWANETWSRRWWGEEKEILIKQTYSVEDDEKHATWLCENAFLDERYITIYGRPAFIIYRPHDLPDYKRTLETIKNVAIKKGLQEPFIIGSNSHTHNLDGFDHVLNFEPQLGLLKNAFNDNPSFSKWRMNIKLKVNSNILKVYDYKAVKLIMNNRKFNYRYLPCVLVGWDNTARRGNKGIIITGQNKQEFKDSLLKAKQVVESYPDEEKIVFINAWNEWAEGNHLEPCIKFGHQFLEAVKEVVNDK